jgi:hypothetical protein
LLEARFRVSNLDCGVEVGIVGVSVERCVVFVWPAHTQSGDDPLGVVPDFDPGEDRQFGVVPASQLCRWISSVSGCRRTIRPPRCHSCHQLIRWRVPRRRRRGVGRAAARCIDRIQPVVATAPFFSNSSCSFSASAVSSSRVSCGSSVERSSDRVEVGAGVAA